MTTTYDSGPETLAHIARVRELLVDCLMGLLKRAAVHDASKLESPEKEAFDAAASRLKDLTYGSPEYARALAELKPALDHHYAHNSHHPFHFANGISGMSLLDLVEMLADWKAAGERHADGSLEQSLRVNRERFAIGEQLQAVLENTARELGWL